MERIFGQDHVIAQLDRQLAGDRLHHAYIFHGPAGVGKFTTALAFARVLLCKEPERTLQGEIRACGQCGGCKLLHPRLEDADASGSHSLDPSQLAMSLAHPDLHIITKELSRFSSDRTVRQRKLTQIPVEVIEQYLLDPVTRGAQVGPRKIFIIDEAELLNLAGQNKMLKTLEEPPADTVIILITSSEERLLPTIRSRCDRLAFRPLPDSVMNRWLTEHASDCTETQRHWLITFSQGSLGKAQLALDYKLSEWAHDVLPTLDGFTQGKFDADLGRRLSEYINAFAQEYVSRMDKTSKLFARMIDDKQAGQELTSKNAANALGSQLMWSMIATHAQQRIHEQATHAPAEDLVRADAMLEPWLEVVDALDRAQQLQASNVNLMMVCDHLVVSTIRSLARLKAVQYTS